MVEKGEENEPYLTKEEIELKLDKIDDLQMQINGINIKINQLTKRVTKLQDKRIDKAGETKCK